ncbi:MAG: aryl-sulfate sulfotransferase [Candidatus Kapabacteria bacterium]|nr:aryl-sulfate sulfotransferase [Candidatus Kapabacteria bacterium]
MYAQAVMIKFVVLFSMLCYPTLTSGLLAQTLPPVSVVVNTTPSPGYIYISPNSRVSAPPYAPALMVLDKDGLVAASKIVREYGFDFRVIPDGRLGYSVFQSAGSGPRASSSIYLVDTNLTTRDSLSGGNGYDLAMHSFLVLPNGNRVIVMQENVTMDMSNVVPGGNPAASVQQMLLQEVDITGRVVFQWRALDHFPVTVSYEDLTAPSIRYFHLNAVWLDTDGNFLISARHSSLIAKIHRTTGEVLWVLGGKANQFVFSAAPGITDPPEFSAQHDIRRLPNGNITLFDNGSLRTPQWSRGVEYEIDETKKTCKLVWQFRHSPDIYAGVQGAMQTLPDGHRLLAWGSGLFNTKSTITEVDKTGTVVFEAQLPSMMYPNKAEKNVYPTGRYSADVLLDEILPKNTYVYTKPPDTVGLTVTYHTLISFFYNTTTARRFQWSPENPSFVVKVDTSLVPSLPPSVIHPCRITLTQEGMVEHAGEFRFSVDRLVITSPQQTVVYYRDSSGKGPFRPLRTRFNPGTRELVVDTASAGEFCFGSPLPGLPGNILAPKLIYPLAGRSVLSGIGVPLQISPQGTSSSFTYFVERADGSGAPYVKSRSRDRDTTIVLEPGMYHWKASSVITTSGSVAGTKSPFSSVDSFFVEGPFVRVTAPANSVVWTQDSSYVVSWNTNLVGLARVELIKDGTVVAVIRDSVRASSGGYLWKVPVTVTPGTGYAVRIRTLDDDPITASAITEPIVEIKMITTGIREDVVDGSISIAPNPASTSIFVGGAIEVSRIMIFAANGELVLDQEVRGTGARVSVESLPNGTYFVRVVSAEGAITKVLSVIR